MSEASEGVPERIWVDSWDAEYHLTPRDKDSIEYVRVSVDEAAVKAGILPQRLHIALHTLWTKAVGQEGYIKAEWRELDDAIFQSLRVSVDEAAVDLSHFLIIEPHADGSVYIVNPDPLLRDPVNGMDAVIAKCKSLEEARSEARRLTSIAAAKTNSVSVDEASVRRIVDQLAEFDNDDSQTCGDCESWYCEHWRAKAAEIITTELRGKQ